MSGPAAGGRTNKSGTSAVRTEGLTRQFGSRTAVDQMTVDIPQSGVVGLVGPNGSGKSTMIRMLLGLVRPTSGRAWVLDKPVTKPQQYMQQVGALIEAPSFVPALSARTNLRSLARLRGLPSGRVAEVLDVVGLERRETEPVKRYSLGMKQRLAIAAALLPDPDLLVLDEPTNGLDPAGIVEIRGLLRRLGASGCTVLVSSHLLAEIQAACDTLVVIRFGQLVFTGTTNELLDRGSVNVLLRPEHDHDVDPLARALGAGGWEIRREADELIVTGAGPQDAAKLNRAATKAGFTLRSLTARHDSLEDVFLALTGADDGELAAARAAEPNRRADAAAAGRPS